MRKMFTKYILSVLALSSSLQILHAAPIDVKASDAGSSIDTVSSMVHLLRDGTRMVLQGIGRNAGRISLGAGALVAAAGLFYWQYGQDSKLAQDVRNESVLFQAGVDDNTKKKAVKDAALWKKTWKYTASLKVDPSVYSEESDKDGFAAFAGLVSYVALLSSGVLYAAAKTCGWIGSKI